MISYIWQSIKTASYWKYAILSIDGIKTFFAVLGGFWLFFEILEWFKWFQRDSVPNYVLYLILALSLIVVIFTRRPIYRIKYNASGHDLAIEVRIGDLFRVKGQKIISTNSTFDTDVANGIISANSVQGQFTQKFFPSNIGDLDTLINQGLANEPNQPYQKIAGKNLKYQLGTTVRVDTAGEIFYLMAMSDLNYNNTAETTFDNVLASIEAVFEFIKQKGETLDVVIPLVGKGRGRLPTNSKRVIARIAQLFMKASEHQHFCSKLIIVIHPNDAKNFNINLHEVRDLLNNYLP